MLLATEDKWTADVMAQADALQSHIMGIVPALLNPPQKEDRSISRRRFLQESARQFFGMQVEPFSQLVTDIITCQYIDYRMGARHMKDYFFATKMLPGGENHRLHRDYIPHHRRIHLARKALPAAMRDFIDDMEEAAFDFFANASDFAELTQREGGEASGYGTGIYLLHQLGLFESMKPFAIPSTGDIKEFSRNALLDSLTPTNKVRSR